MVPLGTLLTVRGRSGRADHPLQSLSVGARSSATAAPGFSSGEALKLMEQVPRTRCPPAWATSGRRSRTRRSRSATRPIFIFALSLLTGVPGARRAVRELDTPAAVILVVPMALVGIVDALVIRGFDNNLYTQIGLVLMIALAAKNAILIVEFARELRAEGMPIVDAAVEATRRRFRPILMTSFAFILGVVPLVTATGAGAASQQALGTVVFGGMLASTLLAIPSCRCSTSSCSGSAKDSATAHATTQRKDRGSVGKTALRLNTPLRSKQPAGQKIGSGALLRS